MGRRTDRGPELLDDMAEQSAIPVVLPIPYDCRPTDATVETTRPSGG